tara:strand:- start:5895 stop:6602 length:708 start_codon:yes stop_codon:yes gene_type:complete
MISPESISAQDIRQAYTLLKTLGSEFVGGFDIDKITIDQNCEGGKLAFVSTEDAYDEDGSVKHDGKPDSMTICLNGLRDSVKGSMSSWKSTWPNMNESYEGSLADPRFARTPFGIILLLILGEAFAHERGHILEPKIVDGNKVPNLSGEPEAEAAGEQASSRLSDILYRDIDYSYLDPNLDRNNVNPTLVASLSSSISLIKSAPSIQEDSISRLKELFSNEISRGSASGSIRRQD